MKSTALTTKTEGVEAMSNHPFEGLRPQRLTAVELRGTCGQGKSRPLIVQCVDLNGNRQKLVVKLRHPDVSDQNYPWDLCVVRDLVGSVIARRLGLTVPDYAIIEFDDNFLAATAMSPSAGRIKANKGMNFGTVMIDAVLEASRPELGSSLRDWASVIVFDALSLNGDRRGGNPNVIWNGGQLYLIDHGLIAPTWLFHLDNTTNLSLYGRPNICMHAGHQSLAGKGQQYDFVQEWNGKITDQFLRWLRSIVPSSWGTIDDCNSLFGFLSGRYKITARQQEELQGVLK